jgi:hypothetical protein
MLFEILRIDKELIRINYVFILSEIALKAIIYLFCK